MAIGKLAMKQSGAKYSFSESTIANRKCQKTTGFISLLEHRKIIANQESQKNARFYTLSGTSQIENAENDRIYELFGTLQIKNVKKRQVL